MNSLYKMKTIFSLLILSLLTLINLTCNSYHPDQFRFVQITDTHVSENGETHKNLVHVLQDIKSLEYKPEFILNTGDITEFGADIEFKNYCDIIHESGLKIFENLGNHDVRWANTGKGNFKKYLGQLFYSFDHRSIHFIMLDSGLLLEQYGHFSKEQLDWLKTDLEKVGREKPIIFAAHHPIIYNRKFVDNEYEVLDLLKDYNTILYLSGHGHSNDHWQANGINFLMTRAVKSNSPGYRIYDIKKDKLNIFTRDINLDTTIFEFSISLRRKKEFPFVEILSPMPSTTYADTLPIHIKSSGNEKIEFSIDNSPWEHLEKQGDSFKKLFDIERLVDGKHTLLLKAVNDSLNYLFRQTFEIDRNVIPEPDKFQTDNAILSKPGVINDVIIFGSTDGKLYALDASNLQVKWIFETKGPIVSEVESRGDTIFVTSGDGNCYAVDKSRGTEIWKTRISESIFSSPTISGGKLVFGASDSSLYALNTKDGKIQWHFKTGNYIKAKPAISPGQVYFGSWDLNFYCLSLNDGSLIWKQKISDNRYFPAATSNPIILENEVIVASHDHTTHAFNLETGEIIWQQFTTPSHKPGYSSPAIYKDNVVLGSLSGHIFSMQAATGKILWTTALPDTSHPDLIFDSSPVITGSTGIVGSINGTVYAVDLNSGKLLWAYKLNDNYIFASPVVWNSYVIVGSCDGALYKLKMPNL